MLPSYFGLFKSCLSPEKTAHKGKKKLEFYEIILI